MLVAGKSLRPFTALKTAQFFAAPSIVFPYDLRFLNAAF
jgi:hypothetical protein